VNSGAGSFAVLPRFQEWLCSCLGLLAVAALAGCATAGAGATAGGAVPEVPRAGSVTAASDSSPLVASDKYIIGQGDVLRVIVLRNPDLSVEVPVRPDGRISTPLVNDMQAVGKTTTQLAHDIEGVLAEYLRSPSVSVIVSHPSGTFGEVRVVGQAVSPKALPFRSGMTVLDAIIDVGGLSQYASGNRAKLIRTAGGAQKEIRLRLDDLLNKGDVSQNIQMQPGDILIIPEARF
jgi:polysaccharide biosynthesis/export protein